MGRIVRIALLLLGVGLLAWIPLTLVDSPSMVPVLWPATGLATGMLLTTPRRLRARLSLATFVILVGVHVATGFDLVQALGFSTTTVATALVVRNRLVAGLDGRRAAMLDNGDVSRFVGAITVGSLLAAVGCGLTVWSSGEGTPWLGALAGFGANAAALMVLLPMFMQKPDFAPLADRRERTVQMAIIVLTTVLVFLRADVPAVMFAVMPMFAWLAFRGTLREASILLVVVTAIGTGTTLLGHGPIQGLAEHYALSPELSGGVLQLFLLDCGLILLPLSVIVTQQRMSTARADADRETLERLVASATGTGIVAVDPEGAITLFNPGAEAMFGYARDEVVGGLPDRFYPPGELERQAASLGATPTFAGICRTSVVDEDAARLWRFVRKDGEERTMRMTLTAVPDATGALSGYLATAEDVTERERNQEALLLTLEHQRTAVDRLRELERVKGDFVATVSHELRTPITSIMGYTELLDEGMAGELTGAQLDLVERIDRNGRRLLLLVEDLLTLSQIESSALTIEPVDTDLCQVVVRAHAAVGQQLVGRTMTATVSVPEGQVCHQADPVQLERMLVNLLTNAVKFTPDGGAVGVVLTAYDDRAEIVVSDTGIGIPAAEQDKLFTRFFRSTTATDLAIQGTGLGLTIVEAVVTLHGGHVDVFSAEGQGTVVTVTLPRAAPPPTVSVGAAARTL